MHEIVHYAALAVPASAVKAAPAAEPDDVTLLLTDRRLVRVSDKKLVYSHIVGKAAGFLSDCCTDEACPRAAASVGPVEQ